MAIAGGNPLFKVDVTARQNGAFMISVDLPTTQERLETEVDADHPLFKDFAMFGAETKVRNTIGAVKASERTPELAKQRAQAMLDAIEEGKWNIGRGEGEATPSGGIVAQAIAQVLGKDVGAVVAHFKAQVAHIEDDKARAKALREAWDTMEADPDFAPTVKAIRDEREAARQAKLREKSGDTAASLKAGLLNIA
jgi:hypothetical protein